MPAPPCQTPGWEQMVFPRSPHQWGRRWEAGAGRDLHARAWGWHGREPAHEAVECQALGQVQIDSNASLLISLSFTRCVTLSKSLHLSEPQRFQ